MAKIMFGRSISVGLILFAMAGPSYAQIPFETLPLLNSGQLTERTELVQSQEDLSALWLEIGRHDQPPVIDFRRHSAVVYFAGGRPLAGYRFSAQGVNVRGGVLEVSVLESQPGGCGGGGLIVTFPGIIIITPPWHREVSCQVSKVIRTCGP